MTTALTSAASDSATGSRTRTLIVPRLAADRRVVGGRPHRQPEADGRDRRDALVLSAGPARDVRGREHAHPGGLTDAGGAVGRADRGGDLQDVRGRVGVVVVHGHLGVEPPGPRADAAADDGGRHHPPTGPGRPEQHGPAPAALRALHELDAGRTRRVTGHRATDGAGSRAGSGIAADVGHGHGCATPGSSAAGAAVGTDGPGSPARAVRAGRAGRTGCTRSPSGPSTTSAVAP